jgi:hypothetical protein
VLETRRSRRAVNMGHQDLDIDAKIDILKHVKEDQRGEMQYRREREYRIFTWSSNILLALIGALLITRQPEGVVWKAYGGWGNIVASAAVVLVVAYSTAWQLRNSKFRGRNAQVISRVGKALHCFERGYFDPEGGALYPDEWLEYGRKGTTLRGRLFGVNYVSATFLLGILALIMIWVP